MSYRHSRVFLPTSPFISLTDRKATEVSSAQSAPKIWTCFRLRPRKSAPFNGLSARFGFGRIANCVPRLGKLKCIIQHDRGQLILAPSVSNAVQHRSIGRRNDRVQISNFEVQQGIAGLNSWTVKDRPADTREERGGSARTNQEGKRTRDQSKPLKEWTNLPPYGSEQSATPLDSSPPDSVMDYARCHDYVDQPARYIKRPEGRHSMIRPGPGRRSSTCSGRERQSCWWGFFFCSREQLGGDGLLSVIVR